MMKTFKFCSSTARRIRPLHFALPPLRSCPYSLHIEPNKAPQTRRRRWVSTLKPSLIKSTDYLDLSHKVTAAVSFPAASSPRIYGIHYAQTARKSLGPSPSKGTAHVPFPDHARGFLYYRADPAGEPLAGGIRLRVTPDAEPSSFDRGEDLLAPSGFPWQIILPQVACRTSYAWIREQLLYENLATQEHFLRCQTMFGGTGSTYPQHLLFRVDSPFLVNFSSTIYLTVVGPTALHPLDLTHLVRVSGKNFFPWTGSAIARLEPSTHTMHAGRRVVHMRILKFVEPVEASVDVDGQGYEARVVRPQEGELFMARSVHGVISPWAYDLDARPETKNAAGLRVLWENSGRS
ncbi:hypothetical protein FB451DRAFT_1291876 [Mycena latifolia]|nr:hypothetical protein FB451DRAFT_1291876 [Mycena latifolia]